LFNGIWVVAGDDRVEPLMENFFLNLGTLRIWNNSLIKHRKSHSWKFVPSNAKLSLEMRPSLVWGNIKA
jgi:hypothetical protein